MTPTCKFNKGVQLCVSTKEFDSERMIARLALRAISKKQQVGSHYERIVYSVYQFQRSFFIPQIVTIVNKDFLLYVV